MLQLVETLLPHAKKIPHVFFMDNVGGIGFEPEAYVDISSTMELKRQMLRCHHSQDAWIKAIYEDASITDLQQSVSAFRGAAVDCAYAEGFRELRTYPRTGSVRLLPGQGL